MATGSLWSTNPVAANDPQAAADGINVGTKFYPRVALSITHLRYYEQSDTAGTTTLRLYNASSTVVASVTHTAVAGQSGWRNVALTTPYVTTVDAGYSVVAHTAGGRSNGTYGTLSALPLSAMRQTSGGEIQTKVDGAAGSVAGNTSNGVYAYGALANPTSTFNSGNYAIDVVFETGSGGSNVSANPADQVAATDAAATLSTRGRNPADLVAVQDAATAASDRTRPVDDPIAAADAITVTWSRSATVTDGIGATDTTGRADARTSSPADAVGVTDSATATRTGAGASSVTDAVAVGDALTVAWSRAATLADAAAIGDALSGTFDRVGTVADFLAATDTPTAERSSGAGADISDPAPVADDITSSTSRSRGPADLAGASDELTVAWGRVTVLADSAPVVDVLASQRFDTGLDTPSARARAIPVDIRTRVVASEARTRSIPADPRERVIA